MERLENLSASLCGIERDKTLSSDEGEGLSTPTSERGSDSAPNTPLAGPEGTACDAWPSTSTGHSCLPVNPSTASMSSHQKEFGSQEQMSFGGIPADDRIYSDVLRGGPSSRPAPKGRTTRSSQQDQPATSWVKTGRRNCSSTKTGETRPGSKQATRQPSILESLRPRNIKSKR
jgi:hypothetical protein